MPHFRTVILDSDSDTIVHLGSFYNRIFHITGLIAVDMHSTNQFVFPKIRVGRFQLYLIAAMRLEVIKMIPNVVENIILIPK